MKFQLMADWPVGQYLVPAGTLIDGGNNPNWNNIPLPMPMPLNAKALDQEGADHLSTTYPFRLYELHAASPAKIRKLINIGD